jgi:HAD superfamily hydrolase (TIGR01484 family)
MLICDFDGTLSGGSESGIVELKSFLSAQKTIQFAIATGRTFQSISTALNDGNFAIPCTIISDVGTQIHHGVDLESDKTWMKQIESRWDRAAILDIISKQSFIGTSNPEHQGPCKITLEGKLTDTQVETLTQLLFDSNVELTYSHDWFLDITPKGIDKASAIQNILNYYGLSIDEVCVAGDSANDESMLTIEGAKAILVGNHYPEVAHLREHNNVYCAKKTHSAGVLEGLKYWLSIN